MKNEQLASIADQIKPKFMPGQVVYQVHADEEGIKTISRAIINQVQFTVSLVRLLVGEGYHRQIELIYRLTERGIASEETIFHTLEEATRYKA